jgi:hypothetical protein
MQTETKEKTWLDENTSKEFIKCNDGIWREDPPEDLITPRFYGKDGLLTEYGFACGYIERNSDRHGNYVTMWREFMCYSVLVWCDGERALWRVYDMDYERAKADFLTFSDQYLVEES